MKTSLEAKRQNYRPLTKHIEKLTWAVPEGTLLTMEQFERQINEWAVEDGTFDELDGRFTRHQRRLATGFLLRIHGWVKRQRTSRDENGRRDLVFWQLTSPHTSGVAWLCASGATCSGCDAENGLDVADILRSMGGRAE